MTSDLKSAAQQAISDLLDKNPVMLFMKGTPEEPKCGFSARVVQLLQLAGARFAFFDVLTDDSIRQGIKEHGRWPTIPQLYINKKLIGGCDIVQDLFESRTLHQQLAPFTSSQ